MPTLPQKTATSSRKSFIETDLLSSARQIFLYLYPISLISTFCPGARTSESIRMRRTDPTGALLLATNFGLSGFGITKGGGSAASAMVAAGATGAHSAILGGSIMSVQV